MNNNSNNNPGEIETHTPHWWLDTYAMRYDCYTKTNLLRNKQWNKYKIVKKEHCFLASTGTKHFFSNSHVPREFLLTVSNFQLVLILYKQIIALIRKLHVSARTSFARQYTKVCIKTKNGNTIDYVQNPYTSKLTSIFWQMDFDWYRRKIGNKNHW